MLRHHFQAQSVKEGLNPKSSNGLRKYPLSRVTSIASTVAHGKALGSMSDENPTNAFCERHARRVETVLLVCSILRMFGPLAIELSTGRLTTLAIGLYALSYLTGGYEGSKSAFASLREGRIDIDLLMILD